MSSSYAAAVAAVGGVLIFVLLFAAACFILYSIGLYTMAKNAGIPNPWLAWIPIATGYILGLLAERSYYTFTGKQMPFSKILLWGYIGVFVGSFIPFISALAGLAGIALMVFQLIALFYLYKDYAPGKEVLYIVLSVIFSSLAQAICLMLSRNTVPVSVTGFGQQVQPSYQGGYQPPYNAQPYGQQPPYNNSNNQNGNNGPEM